MSTIKLFLASSSDLKEDRREFEIFIARKNKDWVSRGAFLELIVWEDFLDAMSKTRLQDEYNKEIRHCDVFVMLFCTKVGQYTQEEFETAFGQFKATNKPLIFTYFKNAEIRIGSANRKDLMSLWAFQEKLDALGHFQTVYENIDELKFKFDQQLDKLLKFVDRYRAEGRIKVDATIVHGAPEGWFLPGKGKVEWFQDYEGGPEMVIVPAGNFMMGSPEIEEERGDDESPRHPVTIARPFAIGRHAVTRGQFAEFVDNTGYETECGAYVWKGKEWKRDPQASWRNPGFPQDDSHPVVCVNWEDVKAFAAWSSSRTGGYYRLPTEAEWEYAARAGTTTPFWWGSTINPVQANYDGDWVYKGGGAKGEYRKRTVAVGNFAANPWGLYQVHGNVWEWCEDFWHDDYDDARLDGSAWLQGGDARLRVVRGGCWYAAPQLLRSAHRERGTTGNRDSSLGFRVVRTLSS